jgi:hypothetical protein
MGIYYDLWVQDMRHSLLIRAAKRASANAISRTIVMSTGTGAVALGIFILALSWIVWKTTGSSWGWLVLFLPAAFMFSLAGPGSSRIILSIPVSRVRRPVYSCGSEHVAELNWLKPVLVDPPNGQVRQDGERRQANGQLQRTRGTSMIRSFSNRPDPKVTAGVRFSMTLQSEYGR